MSSVAGPKQSFTQKMTTRFKKEPLIPLGECGAQSETSAARRAWKARPAAASRRRQAGNRSAGWPASAERASSCLRRRAGATGRKVAAARLPRRDECSGAELVAALCDRPGAPGGPHTRQGRLPQAAARDVTSGRGARGRLWQPGCARRRSCLP